MIVIYFLLLDTKNIQFDRFHLMSSDVLPAIICAITIGNL